MAFGSWVSLAACGLSLVAQSRGDSLVALPGLLTGVTSFLGEHGLQGIRASVVVGLGFPEACGILVPGLGSNPCSLHWWADS